MNLFLVAGAIGCAEAAAELTYRGPEVRTREQSGVLETSITVPTGGFALRRDGIDADGGLLQIRYTLQAPSPDEVVKQVVSELRDGVDIPTGIRRVHVRVARVIQGAHYVVAPRHELAAVLDL